MPDRKARTTPPDGDSARTHKERPDKVLEHQAGPNHRATMEVIPQWLLMPISHVEPSPRLSWLSRLRPLSRSRAAQRTHVIASNHATRTDPAGQSFGGVFLGALANGSEQRCEYVQTGSITELQRIPT